MNAMRICRWIRQAVLVASASGVLSTALSAATFSYTDTDLIAAFRVAGSGSDLVVNLGPVSYYEGLPIRTSVAITNVQPAQLAAVFSSLNKLNWSVSAAMRGNVHYPAIPLQTIWVTSPQRDLYTAGTAWKREGPFTQGTVAAQIDAIGAGAAIYGSTQPAGTNNTQTGIVVSSTHTYSYTVLMTASGDFGGTFQGSAENSTPANFTSLGTPSRSVLYKLLPGSGPLLDAPGQIVGFFDLNPDGSMTFTTGAPPERTAITSYQIVGGTSTVSFGTSSLVYYRLRFTGDLAAPLSTWSTNGNFVIGDGTIQSLQDDGSSSNRFYSVESF